MSSFFLPPFSPTILRIEATKPNNAGQVNGQLKDDVHPLLPLSLPKVLEPRLCIYSIIILLGRGTQLDTSL
jgi:hypothetical protein